MWLHIYEPEPLNHTLISSLGEQILLQNKKLLQFQKSSTLDSVFGYVNPYKKCTDGSYWVPEPNSATSRFTQNIILDVFAYRCFNHEIAHEPLRHTHIYSPHGGPDSLPKN